MSVAVIAHLGARNGGCVGEADGPSMARVGGAFLFTLHPSLVSLDWGDQEGLGETDVSWGSVCPAAPCRGELHPHFNLLFLLWAPHTWPRYPCFFSFHFFLATSVFDSLSLYSGIIVDVIC